MSQQIPAITDLDAINDHQVQQSNQPAPVIPDVIPEQRRSGRAPQPSNAGLESLEYRQREATGKTEGQEWATNQRRPQASITIGSTLDDEDFIACFADTKASHFIPRSYRQAMEVDPDRWMAAMKTEMDTLKAKHTWDLVKPPPGANVMGSMWVYDINVMYHISTSSNSDVSDVFCCFLTFSVVSDAFHCFRHFLLFPTFSVVSDVFRRFPLFPTFSAFFHLFPFVFCPILQFPILGSDRIDSGFFFDPTPFLLAT